jgi:hypothetical protein
LKDDNHFFGLKRGKDLRRCAPTSLHILINLLVKSNHVLFFEFRSMLPFGFTAMNDFLKNTSQVIQTLLELILGRTSILSLFTLLALFTLNQTPLKFLTDNLLDTPLFCLILVEQRVDVPLDFDLERVMVLLSYLGRGSQFLDDGLNIHCLHALLLHPDGQSPLGQLDPDGSGLSLH